VRGNRYSARDGAKGRWDYDWACVAITPPDDETRGHHWLLIRRSLADGELAFYRCWSPRPVGLPTLVRVAGTRWSIEACFQTGKQAVGLDQHQVRRWDSWYRYTTLVMLAHALLTVIAAHEQTRRLLAPHILPSILDIARHGLRWSHWRRRHQARARRAHYQDVHPDQRVVPLEQGLQVFGGVMLDSRLGDQPDIYSAHLAYGTPEVYRPRRA